MNPFQDNVDAGFVLTQPFAEKKPEFDREFTLRDSVETRTTDRSNATEYQKLGTFIGSEPQQDQRVTTNLVAIDENLAMQVGAFLVYTDATELAIKKGHVIFDKKTEKNYKVLSFYRTGNAYKLMVIELND